MAALVTMVVPSVAAGEWRYHLHLEKAKAPVGSAACWAVCWAVCWAKNLAEGLVGGWAES